ncbi:MAG: hypothetical protein EBX52_03650 [Proteobacteria bacterium]|nr:hypothetical protein [Pseudomonadota bacterium]
MVLSIFSAGGPVRAKVLEGGQDLANCCPVCMDLASIQCREDSARAWAQNVNKTQKAGKIEAEIAQ